MYKIQYRSPNKWVTLVPEFSSLKDAVKEIAEITMYYPFVFRVLDGRGAVVGEECGSWKDNGF